MKVVKFIGYGLLIVSVMTFYLVALLVAPTFSTSKATE